MDKFEQAQAELEHRQRQRMVERARDAGLSKIVTYAVEDEDGRPVGVSEYEVGVCWVDSVAPDHAADN